MSNMLVQLALPIVRAFLFDVAEAWAEEMARKADSETERTAWASLLAAIKKAKQSHGLLNLSDLEETNGGSDG